MVTILIFKNLDTKVNTSCVKALRCNGDILRSFY